MSDEEYDWDDYESGPFCRHWSDPSDCEQECVRCGHHCCKHYFGGDTECSVDGCKCPGWVEEGDPIPPTASEKP